MKLAIDFETRSTVTDLNKTGAYVYAADSSTEVLCAAYAVDDGPVELWIPGDPLPRFVFLDHIFELEVHAFNAAFERLMWSFVMSPVHGWPMPKLEQFHCTAAAAAAMALPRGLAKCAQALGMDVEKDAEGHRVMLQLCKPRRPRKAEDPNGLYWWDDLKKYAALYEYCKKDVEVERAIGKIVRPLSDYERKVYLQDQIMNDRGLHLDRDLITAAKTIVAKSTEVANAEIEQLTGGVVEKVTQNARLTRWLGVRVDGVEDVRKDTLRDLLGTELPDDVRRVVEIRAETAKSSTAKLDAMTRGMNADDRARGLLLYHGASTGRWAGKRIQPQNLPRASYWRGAEQVQIQNLEEYIPAILAGDYHTVDSEHPAVVVVSAMLRSMISAAPGRVLMAGDYGQIEARVLAWIAGQEDLLEAFSAGGKIYEEMACRIWPHKFGSPAEVIKDSDERQVSKNSVLGCGFGLGGKGFVAQVKVQSGIELSEQEGKRIVDIYRDRYQRVPVFWRRIDNTALAAVGSPGVVISCGRDNALRFVVASGFLWIILPSGRLLAYADPKVEDRVTPWGAVKPAVSFMGINGYTRKWERQFSYGGLWTENVVQAMARDLIAAAILRLEKAGYRPLLTVHDEVLSEPDEGHGSLEEYINLLETKPKWAAGIPVVAEGWVGERYRK